MQNFIKSQTRLAFVQYIFQTEFIRVEKNENFDDFQNHFYNSNIAIIDEKKEFKLKFNKNFLKKLLDNYNKNIDKKSVIKDLDNFIKFDRKFEKWDKVFKSLIFAIISELTITDKKIKLCLMII